MSGPNTFAHRQAAIHKPGLGDFARAAGDQRGDWINCWGHSGIIQPEHRDIGAGPGFQAADVVAAQGTRAAQPGGIPEIGTLLVRGGGVGDTGGHQAGEQVQQHIGGGGIGADGEVDAARAGAGDDFLQREGPQLAVFVQVNVDGFAVLFGQPENCIQ